MNKGRNKGKSERTTILKEKHQGFPKAILSQYLSLQPLRAFRIQFNLLTFYQEAQSDSCWQTFSLFLQLLVHRVNLKNKLQGSQAWKQLLQPLCLLLSGLFGFLKISRIVVMGSYFAVTPPFQPKAACFSGSEIFLTVSRTNMPA